MAGSASSVALMKRVIKDMNMSDVNITYGMTETSPVSFQSDRTDPLELRVSTVGRGMPHLEVKVVNEAEAIVPPDHSGELPARDYSVMGDQ